MPQPSGALILVLGGTAEARELAGGAATTPGSRSSPRSPAASRDPRLPRGRGPHRRLRRARRAGALARRARRRGGGRRHPPVRRADLGTPPRAPAPPPACRSCASSGRAGRSGPGDRWHRVADLAGRGRARAGGSARGSCSPPAARASRPSPRSTRAWFLIRCVDPPDPPLPPRHELLLDRGPYTLAGELALVDRHAIDLVVTKDSGGSATEAKLDAARERGLPVIVVERPPRPAASRPRRRSTRRWPGRALMPDSGAACRRAARAVAPARRASSTSRR